MVADEMVQLDMQALLFIRLNDTHWDWDVCGLSQMEGNGPDALAKWGMTCR